MPLGGRQKQYGVGDFLGFAKPAHRHHFFIFSELLLAEIVYEISGYKSRRNAVNGNFFPGNFFGK